MPQGIGYKTETFGPSSRGGISSSPGTFELDVLQTGASNKAGITDTTTPRLGIASTPPVEQEKSSLDLSKELKEIQAIKGGGATTGGIGTSLGGSIGIGVGGAIGGPEGAAIGQGVGQALGSVVDYIIDDDSNKKANEERLSALQREKERQAGIARSQANIEALANRRGMAFGREQEAFTKQGVVNDMRKTALMRLLGGINQKAQTDEVLKNKFLKDRRIA
jgi:hypothetical protein